MDIPKNIKCVIFDMGGTLATFPIDYLQMRGDLGKYVAQYGISSDFKPMIQDIRSIAEQLNKPEIVRDLFEIIDGYELKSVPNSSPVENIIQLYKKSSKERKVAILTRNGEKMVHAFLEKYGLPKPDVIVSRDTCANLKPHPEQFECLRKILCFEMDEYMLVGDSHHDRDLAKKEGILFMDVNKAGKKSRTEPGP